MVSKTSILQEVIANPKLLRSFESYLRRNGLHERNLLFIEAMTQMRHEHDPRNIESMLQRIYNTFIAPGAKLELPGITTAEQVREDMDAVHWSILSARDAIKILSETERQVLSVLAAELDAFLCTQHVQISSTDHTKNRIRVVIIGGGFTGFTVASILDPMPLFHVTVIDTKDSFEYTPGIIKRIMNPKESSSMRVRHDAYVRNGRVIIGYADKISNDARSVWVNRETIDFDYLVIATGSSYSSQLKSTDMSSLYRLSGLDQVNAELLKARRVLVVGGGLVGCELASEIAKRTFPGPYPKKHVTLVESHPKVISRSDPEQQDKAMAYLAQLGIELVCSERIVDIDIASEDGVYVGASGRVYRGYDKVFMATGTRPNSQILRTSDTSLMLDSCLDSWGRVRVKPTLQLDHFKYQHIFAGGDVTNVVEEKTGYAATLAGVCIARNICRLVKGKPPLRQGTKGTLPAPDKPLHGILSQGGIGKQKLGFVKKTFAFLNPAWAALKQFDEQQFLKMVQGEAMTSSQIFGRLPRRLTLPPNASVSSPTNPTASERRDHSRTTRHKKSPSEFGIWSSSSASNVSTGTPSTTSPSSSSSSLQHVLLDHFALGGDNCQLPKDTYEHTRCRRRSSMPSITSIQS